jgi:hypothetical protein
MRKDLFLVMMARLSQVYAKYTSETEEMSYKWMIVLIEKNLDAERSRYSVQSQTPAAESAKEASASGKEGLSNTVMMRFSPRPLRRRKRVVEA